VLKQIVKSETSAVDGCSLVNDAPSPAQSPQDLLG